MYSHLVVGTNNLEASRKFYDATFGALGVDPGVTVNSNRFAYITPTGIFAVTRPINGQAATHANGGTIGLVATSPEQVDAWHAAGTASGGVTCEDPPGIRESPVGNRYVAYLRDPVGNKLCAVYPMPA